MSLVNTYNKICTDSRSLPYLLKMHSGRKYLDREMTCSESTLNGKMYVRLVEKPAEALRLASAS